MPIKERLKVPPCSGEPQASCLYRLYICICIHIYVYVYIYICVCVCMYEYIYKYVCVCVYIYICVCVCVCLLYSYIVLYVYICTPTHTHTHTGVRHMCVQCTVYSLHLATWSMRDGFRGSLSLQDNSTTAKTGSAKKSQLASSVIHFRQNQRPRQMIAKYHADLCAF